jgi:hypothetical protein
VRDLSDCNRSAKKNMRRYLLIGLALVALALAVWAVTPLRGAWRSTTHFLPCAIDARVRFEPGAENLAGTVAHALPDAFATVEREQFGPFVKPVVIYVCATPESIVTYGGPKGAGGFVLNGRLFVSPKPQNTAERVQRMLAHELSHLHFEQRLGMLAYARHVPRWFKEGLAVLVSSGGGAESVSKPQAVAAIAAGKTFTPATSGRLFFERSGRSYGLSEHMWYRQSALLVEFMKEKDAAAFRRLVVALADGERFDPTLESSYKVDMEVLVREFRSTIVASQKAEANMSGQEWRQWSEKSGQLAKQPVEPAP